MIIEEIHNSLVTGQRTQMADQIDEYGQYDFWEDYLKYLRSIYNYSEARLTYFADACISYHRLRAR